MGDVGDDGLRPAAGALTCHRGLVGRLDELRLRACDEEHVGALGAEHACGDPADAATGAGHDATAAPEAEVHGQSSSSFSSTNSRESWIVTSWCLSALCTGHLPAMMRIFCWVSSRTCAPGATLASKSGGGGAGA